MRIVANKMPTLKTSSEQKYYTHENTKSDTYKPKRLHENEN